MSLWTNLVMYLPYRFAGYSGKEFREGKRQKEKGERRVQMDPFSFRLFPFSFCLGPATPASGASPEIEANDAAQDEMPLVQVQAILYRHAGVDNQQNDHFRAQPERRQ